VATQDVFSEEELARLWGFPEMNRAELIRYFTLTGADEAFVRRFRTGRNVLGVSVQLCTLPWLGFVPDEMAEAPAAAVGRLSQRLGIAMGELRGYGEREQTRTDHLREVAGYAGWRVMDAAEWKELDEFLFARAMEHDSPKLLFRLACEYLVSSRVIRPGVVLLLRRVAAARARARTETWSRVQHAALADLDAQLAKGNPGEVRLTDDGELIIPPLTAEDVPAEVDALRTELATILPRVPIASVLVEVDARTGFTDHLVHAGGKVARSAELKRNMLYVIIAEATNMGLSAMAESCGVPYDVLAWTAEWYFRPETLEGQRRDGQLPPPAPAHSGVRLGHPVELGRAAVPGQGQEHHRAAPVPVFRPRAGRLDLHPRLRPALHLRHKGHRGHGARVALRAGRAAGQRDRPAGLRARHRHARCDPGQTSPCSTWSASSCRRGSGTSGRSPCTGPGRRPISPPGTRGAGRC
jgi:hypothetical protein